MLKNMTPLEDQPGMSEAIGQVIGESTGQVCYVCGLGRLGHAPESSWLGYDPHPWSPIRVTRDGVERARYLTHLAYRMRRVNAAVYLPVSGTYTQREGK